MADRTFSDDGLIALINQIVSNKRLAGGVGQNLVALAKEVKTALDGKLNTTGGTLTGNLNGQYISGTWLQTTRAPDLGKAPDAIAVLDGSGWLYKRTPAELRDDIGAASKAVHAAVNIPTTGWASDNTADYPNYYDLAVDGVTADHRADVTIAPSSLNTAIACGLCPTTETLEGKIRLRSAAVPSAAIAAEYRIVKE